MFRTGINSLKSLCSSHSLTKIKETLEKCGKLFIYFMRSCDFGDLVNISKAKRKNGPVKFYGETNTSKRSNNMQIFRAFDIMNCQNTFLPGEFGELKRHKITWISREFKSKSFCLIGFWHGNAVYFWSSCNSVSHVLDRLVDCLVFPAMLTFCKKGKFKHCCGRWYLLPHDNITGTFDSA